MTFEHAIDLTGAGNKSGNNALHNEYISSNCGGGIRPSDTNYATNRDNPSPKLPQIDLTNGALPTDINNRPQIDINNRVPQLDPTNRLPQIDINNHLPPLAPNNRLPPIDINNRVPSLDPNNRVPQIDINNLVPRPNLNNGASRPDTSNGIQQELLEAKQLTSATKAPDDDRVKLMMEGHKQLQESLPKGKWPDKEEGNLVLSMSLDDYYDGHGADFLKAFAKDSNDALQASPLKDKVKIGVSAATEDQRKALADLEKQYGAKLADTGILELRDRDGKVTDRRLVGVFKGDKKQIVMVSKL